jgi:hypothetical protein
MNILKSILGHPGLLSSHKWNDIYEIRKDHFMGETVEIKEVVYRICWECQKVQHKSIIGWIDIKPEYEPIIIKNLKVINGLTILVEPMLEDE